MIKIRDLARAAASISLVFVVTGLIPHIKIGPGYFNFSDSIIMIIALVYGGKIGAISAIGAALGDFYQGYATYIPFTIMTKVFTGYMVGRYRSILFVKHSNRVILSSIVMFYMVFTYVIHDWIVLGNGFILNHIGGNLLQGVVSIVIFDVFSRKFSKYFK